MHANLNIQGRTLFSSNQICTDADDIRLVARNVQSLCEVFYKLNAEVSKLVIVKILKRNTYMWINPEHTEISHNVETREGTFEAIKTFTHLGHLEFSFPYLILTIIRNVILPDLP